MNKIITFTAAITLCNTTYSAQNQSLQLQSSSLYQPLTFKEEWQRRQLPEADHIKEMLTKAGHHQFAQQIRFIRSISREKFVYPTLETFAYNECHNNHLLTQREAQEGSLLIFRAGTPVEVQGKKTIEIALQLPCERAINGQLGRTEKSVLERLGDLLQSFSNAMLTESQIRERVVNACAQYNARFERTIFPLELAQLVADSLITMGVPKTAPAPAKL